MTLLKQYKLDTSHASRMTVLEKELHQFFNENETRAKVMAHVIRRATMQKDEFDDRDTSYTVSVSRSTKKDLVCNHIIDKPINNQSDITIVAHILNLKDDPKVIIQLSVDNNDDIIVKFVETYNETHYVFDAEETINVLKEFIGV